MGTRARGGVPPPTKRENYTYLLGVTHNPSAFSHLRECDPRALVSKKFLYFSQPRHLTKKNFSDILGPERIPQELPGPPRPAATPTHREKVLNLSLWQIGSIDGRLHRESIPGPRVKLKTKNPGPRVSDGENKSPEGGGK